jgi:hypothetical protein
MANFPVIVESSTILNNNAIHLFECSNNPLVCEGKVTRRCKKVTNGSYYETKVRERHMRVPTRHLSLTRNPSLPHPLHQLPDPFFRFCGRNTKPFLKFTAVEYTILPYWYSISGNSRRMGTKSPRARIMNLATTRRLEVVSGSVLPFHIFGLHSQIYKQRNTARTVDKCGLVSIRGKLR